MKKIITLLIVAFCLNARGQSEFIGIINPNTGTDNIIDSIPGDQLIYDGVSTFDDNNHRFIFYGTDRSGNKHLYCINAITGAIISQATFTLNAGEFQYDNSSNTLYTLYSGAGNILTLASIDISTATATTITTFTVSGYGGGTTFFDEANHTYVMQNSGSFYSVNVNTGSITTTPAPTGFNEMQFDNSTGISYGLVMVGASMYLVKINVNNGTYITIDTLSSGYEGQASFDEANHIYTYQNNNHLYSINVNTGVISNTPFPAGISNMINFEFQYDNSSSILYSIQWGTLPSEASISQISGLNTSISIYPNPTNNNFTIETLNTDKQTLQIFDVNGKLVLTQTIDGKTNIDATNLSEGVYNLSLINTNGVANKRLVIVR